MSHLMSLVKCHISRVTCHVSHVNVPVFKVLRLSTNLQVFTNLSSPAPCLFRIPSPSVLPGRHLTPAVVLAKVVEEVFTKWVANLLWWQCGLVTTDTWQRKYIWRWPSYIRHEDFLLLLRPPSGSGYPPWILKWAGLESSGRRLNS